MQLKCAEMSRVPECILISLKGAGQFDGSKNYVYFGGLVKKKVHI